jgi:hypothetical protein
MEPNMNEELWRVQLSTGEIRMMTLDALDRAFDDGLIDARVPVLAPGASAWTTLGEAAGLELDEEEAPKTDQTPSLSPVALGPPSSAAISLGDRPEPESLLDLDLPDNFEELRPRRRTVVVGGIVSGMAAMVMLAVVVARVGSGMPATADITSSAAAVQAPPVAAVESLPAAKEEPKKEEPKKEDAKPELSDWQKRMLVDADKAREEKAKAKREAEKAAHPPAPKKPKASPGLLNGGDRFDPLNGAL